MEDKRHEYFRKAIEDSKDKEALELLMVAIESIMMIGKDDLSRSFVIEECNKYMAAYSKGSQTRDCIKKNEQRGSELVY